MSGYVKLTPAGNRFMVIDLGDGPEMIMLEAAGVAVGPLEPDQEHAAAVNDYPGVIFSSEPRCPHGLPSRLCMQCPESGLRLG